jgi:hypothetical protein
MTSVGDRGLTCLDGSEYAAIALSMQANAETIDETLSQIQSDVTAYGSSFVFSFTSTSASVITDNSGEQLPDGTVAQSLTTVPLGVVAQGWYSVAASMTYIPTGAVTASTYRRGVLWQSSGNTGSYPLYYQTVNDETGTGTADSMTVNGWFYADGIKANSIRLLFGHGNTGSTISVSSGARLTIRFMTSGLVI